jgi:MoaA/NifB/PqqE/SkfB family radical SAM enzyme
MLKDLCFEIIQKCPNNCMFCSSMSSIDSEIIISLDIFKKTIDKFMSLGGIKEISISGGEPFLHPNLLEMVEYCKNKGIRTVIYTSGIKRRIKLREEEKTGLNLSELKIINQIEENGYDSIDRFILRRLKGVGLDKIVFDFQVPEVDGYNYLMGTKNQYPHVLMSLLNTNFEGIESEIHFIPLISNYKLFKEVIELAELGGVRRVSVLRFVPQGRGKDNVENLMLSKDQLNEFRNIVSSITSSKVEIRMGIPMTEEDTHLCTAGYSKYDIRYDGIILPCPSIKDTDLKVLEENGVKVYSIYEDLEDVTINEGSKTIPLCKKIHFNQK